MKETKVPVCIIFLHEDADDNKKLEAQALLRGHNLHEEGSGKSAVSDAEEASPGNTEAFEKVAGGLSSCGNPCHAKKCTGHCGSCEWDDYYGEYYCEPTSIN